MFHIRLASPSDLAAVLATEHTRAEGARRAFVQRAIHRRQCWVAESDEHVRGYIVADESFFGHPFIALLMVNTQFRRRGVGLGLMRHVEDMFPGSKLFTSTNESNRPMHALLDKLGYVRSGVIENLDEGDPEVVYVKRTDPTPP